MAGRVDRATVADAVTRNWNRRAARYNEFYARYPAENREHWCRLYRHALAELFGGDHGRLSVLDVGTGTGFSATLLAELGHDVTAVDASAQMLDHAGKEAARRGVDLRLVRHDAHDVAALGSTFDLVTSRFVVWTLSDPQLALARWRAVLRPGGAVLVSDGVWRSWRLTGRQLRDSLRPGGDRGFGWRLVRDYAAAGRALPYWRGISGVEAEALLSRTGFAALTRFESVLPLPAHPVSTEFYIIGGQR